MITKKWNKCNWFCHFFMIQLHWKKGNYFTKRKLIMSLISINFYCSSIILKCITHIWIRCQNGFIVLVAEDQCICKCKPGYHGEYCQSTSDPCSNNPCHNGGLCEATSNGFSCTFRSEHAGQKIWFCIFISEHFCL